MPHAKHRPSPNPAHQYHSSRPCPLRPPPLVVAGGAAADPPEPYGLWSCAEHGRQGGGLRDGAHGVWRPGAARLVPCLLMGPDHSLSSPNRGPRSRGSSPSTRWARAGSSTFASPTTGTRWCAACPAMLAACPAMLANHTLNSQILPPWPQGMWAGWRRSGWDLESWFASQKTRSASLYANALALAASSSVSALCMC